MRRLTFLISFLAALAARADGGFGAAAAKLGAGERDAAAEVLLEYARRAPAAPLANQALDVVLMLDGGKATPAQLVPYVEALALLADGFTATADVAFRGLAADEQEPWAVRGRSYLVVSELNVHGDARAMLEAGWRDCPDETGRLLGVALADTYYRDGEATEALKVRAEFARRWPADAGINYFNYLLTTPQKGAR